jgi:hypothetical protein
LQIERTPLEPLTPGLVVTRQGKLVGIHCATREKMLKTSTLEETDKKGAA